MLETQLEPVPSALPPRSESSSSTLEAEGISKLEAMQNQLTEREFDDLESELKLRAAVLGWTGDPLRQPAQIVLGMAEAILQRRQSHRPVNR